MASDKPKMRMPPTPAELTQRQEAANRLLQLDDWTAEPGQLAGDRTATATTPPPEPAKAPGRPWETPGSDKAHPYHIVCSEALFQKMDFVWKRSGSKSMREWVLTILQREADEALRRLE